MKPKIFVVIPIFNRLEYTKKCLSSIFSQTYRNFSVIVVDDGSSDGTSKYLKDNYPKVKIIKGDGNWWWTKSMFMGIKYALKSAKVTDYILEMNNDLFFDKNYFQNLINTSKKHKKTLIGSLCVRAQKPSEVVEAGIRIDWPTGLVYGVSPTISNKLSYYKNMEVIDNLDALPGKGTLVPVEVFKNKVNFKYKLLPHYIADYEFAINAKQNGFNLIVSTKAKALHYWEATGISGKANESKQSYLRAFNLLFGRKSMNNIIDWVRFITIACPKKYKLRNYYFAFCKIVKAIFSLFPFYYLLPILTTFVRIYHILSLNLYRFGLKIVQFPEYHLGISKK